MAVNDIPAPLSNSLIDRIKRQISLEGPISIGEYMSICLGDPQAGYYTTGKPFGRDGDFITAPEISQMFGEMIGVWSVLMWRNMGKPPKFNLVEMGPGRGTLMVDLLRAAKIEPEFRRAVQLNLVEISQPLRDQQDEALSDFDGTTSWLDDLQKVSSLPTIFIGNEFLDALPFRQYVKTKNHWLERVVGAEKGELCYSVGHGFFDKNGLPSLHDNQPDGTIFEISSAREAVVQFIAEHMAKYSGAALLIDYGYLERGFGDTFQAVAKHEYGDPLKSPGNADLTSHVDFSVFAKFFESGANYQLTTQADFLLSLGLLERAGSLGHGKPAEEQRQIEQAAERLAGSGEMGKLFKVLIAGSRGVDLAGN